MKISKTHHVTKKGTVKKNPVRTVKFYRGYASKKREPRIDFLVKRIQASSFIPIRDVSFAKDLMNERISDDLLYDSFWSALSTDKRSGKLFLPWKLDPTDAVVFVDTSFLRLRRGNEITLLEKDAGGFGKSVEKVTRLINSGVKLDSIPYYKLRDGEVGEGNHRVEALHQLGYASVPVSIGQGWQ